MVNISHPEIESPEEAPPPAILSKKPPAMQSDSIITRFLRPSEYEAVKTRYDKRIIVKLLFILSAIKILTIRRNSAKTSALPGITLPEAMGLFFFAG